MSSIHDSEFGDITVRRSSLSRSMKASVGPNGALRITLPTYVPLIMAKRMVTQSRKELRELLNTQPKLELRDGMAIGKSHTLIVRKGSGFMVKTSDRQIIVQLSSEQLTDTKVDEKVREAVRKALRKEAKHYLPRRLEYIAKQYDFRYTSVRFSHASSRWGSCSSNGTISLNIALMMLPVELIDYVVQHELAHTKEMNHSQAFWAIVESMNPQYKTLRKQLKTFSPTV